MDVWDLATGKWSLTHMSISHFYMASAAAGPYAIFCGGTAQGSRSFVSVRTRTSHREAQ